MTMNDSVQTTGLDTDQLRDWIQQQRWYAPKSRSIASVEIAEHLVLNERLLLALVQTRFATGTHQLYQLRAGEGTFDALTEPELALELMRRMESGTELEGAEGRFAFYRAGALPPLGENARARLIGVEQSNSSVVLDDRVVLKLFRKL